MTDPTPPPVPRWLRAWAILTACAALPLALLGAETTTRGVGMADQVSVRAPWYFFTLDLADTPLGLLIEHGHRLFGWALGVCCIVLAVGLLAGARSWHRWLGLPALLLVSAQGVFGILRVKYNALAGPELAAFHGCFAQLAFASLAVVAVLCSRTWSTPAVTPAALRVGGLALCAVVYLQIVFGAVTRHLLSPVGQRLHVLLAFAVLGVIFWMHGKLRREGDNRAARLAVDVLSIFVLIQPVLGVEAWLRRFGAGTLPELVPADTTMNLIRSGHHLLGTLIFVTAAAVAALLLRRAPAPQEEPVAVAAPTRQLEGSV